MTRPEVHCSALGRIEKCPGALLAGAGLATSETPESISGNVTHGALKMWALGRDVSAAKLDDREEMIFRWFKSEVERVEEAHGGANVRVPEYKIKVGFENFILVGTLDLLIITADWRRIIIDYKTGWAQQTPAKDSRQVMGYTLGVREEQPEVEEFDGYIFSAGDPKETRFTKTSYTVESLEAAKRYMEEMVGLALLTDAPRIDGDHCQYCPALGTAKCPETAGQIVAYRSSMTPAFTALPEPSRCREIYEAIKAVEKYAKAFEPILKQSVMDNPESWKDYFTVRAGAKKRSFVSIEKACNRLAGMGFSPEEIWPFITFTPAKAETLIAEKAGLKGKAAGEYFAEKFGDLIDVKENAPSIAKVK